jgi:hypothetical protein
MRGLSSSIGLVLVLATLAGGCHRREPATRAVERYFAAVTAHDCQTLMPMTPPSAEATTCQNVIDSFEHRQARLIAVRGSEPDGRDRSVTIVRARVAFSGHEADWLVRATPREGGWTLRF